MEADFSGCYVVYICLERTNSTFQGSQNHHDAVVDSVLSKVALWAMRCKEFHGYMLIFWLLFLLDRVPLAPI